MNILNFSNDNKDTLLATPMPDSMKKEDRIIIITADKTQDLEFFYPYYRFIEEGYLVDVVTPEGKAFEGKYGMGLKFTKAITEVKPSDYELLYIPGGKAPQELRKNSDVINFVTKFAVSEKPIAAICHGPQVLISAGLVKGRRMAVWPEVEDELKEAGAIYVNEAVVEDGTFITSRKPGDLPRHLSATLKYLQNNANIGNKKPYIAN